MERLLKLRSHAIDKQGPGSRSAVGQLLWYRGWIENHSASSNILRRAKAKGYLLRGSTPVIDEGELIVGKPCYRELSATEQDELSTYKNIAEKAALKITGQGSHMAVDYEKLLSMGLEGVRNEILEYRKLLKLEISSDMEKEEFYLACLEVLDAVSDYADRYAKYAEQLAKEAEGAKRKEELNKIARICRKVPRYPAECFYEATQSIHFLTFCLEGLYQLGRPDRYLLNYYHKSISTGEISAEFAQELIDCLCILFNEYIPKGLAVGFMVGGRDSSGVDISNELTYMFIESIGHTSPSSPDISGGASVRMLLTNISITPDTVWFSLVCTCESFEPFAWVFYRKILKAYKLKSFILIYK